MCIFPQLALEEFVDCTMRVHALGVDLLTLQLQLVLAERAYYGNDLSEDVQEMVTQVRGRLPIFCTPTDRNVNALLLLKCKFRICGFIEAWDSRVVV